MLFRLSLELPEDDAHIAIARLVARNLLEHLRVDPQDIDDIEVVIGELATNAVRHSKDVRYRADLEFHSDHVIVTVSDNGSGFVPEEIPPPGTLREDAHGDLRFGGFGLPLVRSLADRVQFLPGEPQGTTVRAEKWLRYRN